LRVGSSSASITNQALDREETFILLSASHSMRVSTSTTAISGPVLYVDGINAQSSINPIFSEATPKVNLKIEV